MTGSILLLPLLSALIGWLSVTLALRVILHSLRKHRLDWAEQISSAILTDLAPPEEIIASLSSVDISDKLANLLPERVQTVLDRFKEATPMVGMFLNETVSDKIKKMVIEEIKKEWPTLQRSMTSAVIERFDLKAALAQKIHSIPTEQIEQTIKKVAEPRWQQLAWSAAALGFVIGLLQAGLVACW